MPLGPCAGAAHHSAGGSASRTRAMPPQRHRALSDRLRVRRTGASVDPGTPPRRRGTVTRCSGPWDCGSITRPSVLRSSKRCGRPTEPNVHGDALRFVVMGPLLQRLAVGGKWRFVAGGGSQLAVGGGWRLAVGSPWGLSLTNKMGVLKDSPGPDSHEIRTHRQGRCATCPTGAVTGRRGPRGWVERGAYRSRSFVGRLHDPGPASGADHHVLGEGPCTPQKCGTWGAWPLRHRGGGCIRGEGTAEAAPEAVRQAVGGGCPSGRGQLLPVTNAIEAGTWRQGDSGWAWVGHPEGGKVTCPPSNASLGGCPTALNTRCAEAAPGAQTCPSLPITSPSLGVDAQGGRGVESMRNGGRAHAPKHRPRQKTPKGVRAINDPLALSAWCTESAQRYDLVSA